MQTTKWKDLAELVGFAAIVASLLFVAAQMRQDRIIAVAELNMAWTETQVSWANLVSLNHDLWVRGLDGEALQSSEQARFDAMANTYYSKETQRYSRAKSISLTPAGYIPVEFAHVLFSHPSLREFFETRFEFRSSIRSEFSTRASNSFVSIFQKTLGELDRGEREHVPLNSYALM
jgi:hypothetical protein